MVRFRCQSCLERYRSGEGAKPPLGARSLQQAGVGAKTRSAGREPAIRRCEGKEGRLMEIVCTGRGIHVTDDMRRSADRKLGRLTRIDSRINRIDVEIIVEKNPRLAHLKRVEAALVRPRRTFRAHAEDPEFEKALDSLVERLERQVRDHREKRRARVLAGARSVAKGIGLESAHPNGASADTSE